MDKLLNALRSLFPKKHYNPTVPYKDYADIKRGIAHLEFDNGILKKRINEILSTDKAIMREELESIKSASYDLLKRMEKILEVKND